MNLVSNGFNVPSNFAPPARPSALGRAEMGKIFFQEPAFDWITDVATVFGGGFMSIYSSGFWEYAGYGVSILGSLRLVSRFVRDDQEAVVWGIAGVLVGLLGTSFLIANTVSRKKAESEAPARLFPRRT